MDSRFAETRVVGKIDGRIAVKIKGQAPLFLEDDGWSKNTVRKNLRKYKNRPMFTIYMGHCVEDFDVQRKRALENGIEVFQLDAPEEWGYDFIAVRNREVEVNGEILRYSPFEDVDIASEFSLAENDFRDERIGLRDFMWGGKMLQEVEIPLMIRCQVITLEQVTEGKEL
jgi:hypothetical protein